MTRHLIAVLAVLSASCAGPRENDIRPATARPTAAAAAAAPPSAPRPPATQALRGDEWTGVYATPREISGFAGTVLALDKGPAGQLRYRVTSYSDVIVNGDMGGGLTTGSVRVDGAAIRLSDERYTRMEINGHRVLMRDDAMRAFREKNQLYDYGILILIDAEAGPAFDPKNLSHPSIKLLYSDPTKPWKDPFVNGPNDR